MDKTVLSFKEAVKESPATAAKTKNGFYYAPRVKGDLLRRVLALADLEPAKTPEEHYGRTAKVNAFLLKIIEGKVKEFEASEAGELPDDDESSEPEDEID